MTSLYYAGTGEAAAYGGEAWKRKRHEEGAPYLAFAQKKYYEWLMRHGQETTHSVCCRAMTLALLDQLLILWENREEGRETAIRERIEQVSANWLEYML